MLASAAMLRHALLSPLLLTSLALAGTACKSEIDGKPAAKVEDAASKKTEEPAKPPASTTTKYTADPAASSIGFVGAKVTGDHKGGFERFTGEAEVTDGKPSRVAFTVEMDSLTTDADGLTGHLKSDEFFDVAKFPNATFTSTAIAEKAGDGGATHEITGDLELHGAKKSITFPATLKVESTAATGEAEFTINRKDFGIEYPGKPDDLIKDEVLLKIKLQFKV